MDIHEDEVEDEKERRKEGREEETREKNKAGLLCVRVINEGKSILTDGECFE